MTDGTVLLSRMQVTHAHANSIVSILLIGALTQYIVIVLRIQKLGDAARKRPFNRQASPASRSIAVRASCFPFRASCSAVFPMYLIDGSALCSSSTRHAGSFPTHAARHKAVAPSPRLALMSVLGWPSSPSSAFIAAMCG